MWTHSLQKSEQHGPAAPGEKHDGGCGVKGSYGRRVEPYRISAKMLWYRLVPATLRKVQPDTSPGVYG